MTDEEREWVDADLSPEADADLWLWQGRLPIDPTHDVDDAQLEAPDEVEPPKRS